MNFNVFYQNALKLISFVGMQYAFGKKASFPYGLVLKFSLEKIAIIVIFSDIMQTFFLLALLDISFKKIPCLRKLREKFKKKEKRTEKSRISKFKRWGSFGLFFVAALPYAGGALTGSILSYSMGIKKKKAFFIIVGGCTLGAAIFYLSFSGILLLVNV